MVEAAGWGGEEEEARLRLWKVAVEMEVLGDGSDMMEGEMMFMGRDRYVVPRLRDG